MLNRIIVPTCGTDLVDTFWDLAKLQDEKRVSAARCMIDVIKRSQGEDTVVCQDLEYAVQRLVRGVSSPRKFARIGFSMALTQVLKEFPVVKPNFVLRHADEELQTTKSDKKNETSNIILGRVMVCMCIVQSGSLARAEKKDAAKVLKWLLEAKQQKLPLHQICVFAIEQLISEVAGARFESEVLPHLDGLSDGWDKCTPDTLLLLLSSHRHHSKVVGKSFLANHWNCKKLFGEKTWSHLAHVMANSTVDHPIVHSVCHRLLEFAAQNPETYTNFWTHVIEGDILHKRGQKCMYLCFQLIPSALRLSHTAEQVSMIMSSSLVHLLVKNLSSSHNLLHTTAQTLVQEIVKFVTQCKDGEKQTAVLQALVSHPSSVKFDQLVSKVNAMNIMENALVSDGAELWSEILMSVARGESSSSLLQKVDNTEGVRMWSISRLANLITVSSKHEDQKWQSNILQFLFTHGYFTVGKSFNVVKGQLVKKCTTPLSKTCQSNLAAAFSKALHRLATFRPGKYSGRDSSVYVDQVYKLVLYAQELLRNTQSATPIRAMTEETQSQWNETTDKIQAIHSKRLQSKKGNSAEGEAFQLLLMQLALQLFTEPDSAAELLQDVIVCHEKANQKKKREGKLSDREANEAGWIEVFTEVLISMMSKESAMVRTVTTIVFSKMCSHITLPALQLILDVLTQKKDEEDGPLGFEDSEDEDMETEEDGVDDDESEDETSSSEEAEDESEVDSGTDEDDDDMDSQVSELRAKLKAELGDAAIASDEEKSDDEDFDDETMMKLDSKIAEAFRHMTKNKKAAKLEELQMMHFKNRCLDLLQQFVNSEPSVSLASELLVPLLELMEMAARSQSHGNKELQQKAAHVFNSLCKIRKFSEDAGGVDSERLLEILASLIELSTSVSGVLMVKNVGSACLLVMKMVHGGDDGKGVSPLKTRSGAGKKEAEHNEMSIVFEKMLRTVRKTLEDFCTRRDSKFSPGFFHHMCERQPGMLWPVAGDLLGYASRPDVRIFCRTQACTTLTGMINRGTMQIIKSAEWIKFSQQLCDKLPKMIEELADQDEYRPRYVHETLLVVHRVLNTDSGLKDKIVSLMGENLKKLATKVKSENLALLRKIFVVLGFGQENLARSGKRQRKRSVSTGSVEEAIQNHHPSEQSETNAHTKKRKRHEKHQAENGQSVQGGQTGGQNQTADTEGTKPSKKNHKKKLKRKSVE